MMSRFAYDHFVELRAGMQRRGLANLAQVFVPVGLVPKPDVDERRVLFVGRATRQFDDAGVRSYDGAARRAIETFRTYNSPYWSFLRRILATAGATMRPGGPGFGKPTIRHGWSNAAKIGDTRGNPASRSLSLQGVACCDALRAEIAMMQPHAIVVMTGSYAQAQIFGPVFGAEGWTSLTADVRWKRDHDRKALLLHTYHPQQKVGSRGLSESLGQLLATGFARDPDCS